MRISLPRLELRKTVSITLILLATLLILAETSRGILFDPRRVYGSALSSLLLFLALRLRGSVRRTFLLPVIPSFIFPPILLLVLLLPKDHERPREVARESGEAFDLLRTSYGSNLVICRSVRLMGSVAISLASELSRHRRVVLVDWSGEAHLRLGKVDHRIAEPSDICLGYQGDLGASYHMTLSELLSYLTGADPSYILGLLRGDVPPVLRDPRMGDSELITSLARSNGLRIEEALPKLSGVLIIDASKLNIKGKNALSLMTLLQCCTYEERDFLVIAPLLSPLTDERIHPRIRDELRWMISSLSKAGCFILSTKESSSFSDEFDNVIECDSCTKHVYKLDSFLLCPWRGNRGRRGV